MPHSGTACIVQTSIEKRQAKNNLRGSTQFANLSPLRCADGFASQARVRHDVAGDRPKRGKDAAQQKRSH